MNHLPEKIALAAFVVACSAMSVRGQLPIPVAVQSPAPGVGRGGGRGPAPVVAQPAKQEVTAIPTAVEVSGPGDFFETFMDDHDDATKTNIPAKDIYAKFGYEAREYFVSGTTSSGMPYKTRIVIRKPSDNAKFNGLIWPNRCIRAAIRGCSISRRRT